MTVKLSENAWSALRCPHCLRDLRRMAAGADCGACGVHYPVAATGALDLRLRKRKVVQHEHVLGEPLPAVPSMGARDLPEKREPEVDFGDLSVPYHLTSALLSYIPRAVRAGELALDLGCGAAWNKTVCEAAGFEYVGLDYESDSAQLLGDAHALPFADQSFGFAISIAVLEHIRFPFVAMSEVCRVLRPGAPFIGTVAFLEPFHANSYFHHSHLGVLTSLLEGGFEIDSIAPRADWDALTAQADMALFPKMPGAMQRGLIWPLQLVHRRWWAVGRRVTAGATEAVRIRNLTGAFSFVARRPAADFNTPPASGSSSRDR